MNRYSGLPTATGREAFISSIELMYIALAPHLKESDRKFIKSYIVVMRSSIDRLNSGSGTMSEGANISILKKQAWTLLEILSLLKDKRGLGIPREKKLKWEEEFSESLDVKPKGEEDEPDSDANAEAKGEQSG